MRYPLSCRVFGNPEGFAGQLRDQLVHHGATIISSSTRLEHRHLEDPTTDVLFLDLHDLDLGEADLEALTRFSRLRLEQRPILVALANSQTALDLLRSYAWAAGFDDVIEDHAIEGSIEQRLDSLALLAKAKREAGLRADLAELYALETKPRATFRNSIDQRARILVVGRASIYQVKIVDALPAARIAYAESPGSALAMVEVESFDLVLADCALSMDGTALDPGEHLRAALGGRQDAPLIGICTETEADMTHNAGRFDDVVVMPLPTPILRLRIELWLKIARLQGWQRPSGFVPCNQGSTPLAAMPHLDEDLVFDRLTGLPGRAFTMDCVRLATRHAQFSPYAHQGSGKVGPHAILISIANFDSLNIQAGFAAGSRLLVKCASRLRKGLRAADYLGYLGRGHFLIVLPLTAADEATAIAERAHKLMATAHHAIRQSLPPPMILEAILPLPESDKEAVMSVERALEDIVRRRPLGGTSMPETGADRREAAEPDLSAAPASDRSPTAADAAVIEQPTPRPRSRLFRHRPPLQPVMA